MSTTLDVKQVSSPIPYIVAEQITALAQKGYVPVPLRCVNSFGTMIITMALYAEEETVNTDEQKESTDESVEKPLSSKLNPETTSTDGDGQNQGEAGEESNEKGSGEPEQPAVKPKTASRSKPKPAK